MYFQYYFLLFDWQMHPFVINANDILIIWFAFRFFAQAKVRLYCSVNLYNLDLLLCKKIVSVWSCEFCNNRSDDPKPNFFFRFLIFCYVTRRLWVAKPTLTRNYHSNLNFQNVGRTTASFYAYKVFCTLTIWREVLKFH